MLGTVRDASYLGVSTSYIVETKGGGIGHGLRAERRSAPPAPSCGSRARRSACPGRRPHLRRRGRRRAAAGRPRRRAWPRPAAPPVPPPPSGISRRKFVVGGAIAVAAVGFGAFLASTAGSGTTAAPSGSTALASSTPPPKPSTAPSAGASAPPPRRAPSPSPACPRRPARSGSRTGSATWTSTTRRTSFPTLEQFTKRDRHQGRLRRGDRRQRGVLHAQPRRSAGRRPADRVGPRRPDRLDDRPAHPARLAGGPRPAMPNFPANLLTIYHGRSFDPNTNLAAPWQSGMTGLGVRPEEDRPAGLARGPVHATSSPAR